MGAKRVLGHAGFEGVDRQRILAAQQLEISWKGRQVEYPFLGADAATTLGQHIQINPGAEPHPPAVATAFSNFKQSTPPMNVSGARASLAPPDRYVTRAMPFANPSSFGRTLSRASGCTSTMIRETPASR